MTAYSGLIRESWRLLWRHRKMMYWVFVVTLIFGWISSLAVHRSIGRVLDHSLASGDLVYGFDLARFTELTKSPEVNLTNSAPTAVTLSLVFLVYMVFITGGVLQTYRENRRVGIGEFFDACGHHLWRFLRLMFISLLPLGAILLLARAIREFGAHGTDRQSVLARAAAAGIGVVLVLLVRLWFDVAQVRAVAQDEHFMLRNLYHCTRIMRDQFLRLLWIYFRISLLAWISLVVGAIVWMKLIPPDKWLVSFVWIEVILFFQLATRFWQRAAAVQWYGRFAEVSPELAVDSTAPKPEEIAP